MQDKIVYAAVTNTSFTAGSADLGKLAGRIPFSEAGVTMRETRDLWDLPLVFLVLVLLRFSEWWLRRKWGIV